MNSDPLDAPITCPAAWPRMRLKQIATKIGSGATPTGGQAAYQLARSKFALIRSQNVFDRVFSDVGLAFISDVQAEGLRGVLLQPNDLLLNITGDGVTFGRACMVPSRVLPACVNQHVSIIRVDTSKADAGYVLSYLTHPMVKEYVEAFNAGGSRRAITKAHIESFVIPLPPLNVQRDIAQTLSALDDRIALLRETNATLEAIAQALFKSWFVDFDPVRAKSQGLAPAGMDEPTAALFSSSFEESALGLVPKGWRVFRLGDVVARITKGTTPTTLGRRFEPSGINFVKAESMTGDGGFIPEKFAFIDDETHQLLKRSQLEDGDVLISIAGTIGRIAVVTSDILPANTNQAVALIRPLPQSFPSGLICRFLQRGDTQQLMGERVVQAVQANLSLGSLSDMKIVLPAAEIACHLYQAGMAQVDARKAMNNRRVRTLTTLRDTLLPRLISGQLCLPDVESVAT